MAEVSVEIPTNQKDENKEEIITVEESIPLEEINTEKEEKEVKEKEKEEPEIPAHHDRRREIFSNKYDHYLSLISATLCFHNYDYTVASSPSTGALSFLLIYVVMILLVGLPMLLLEMSMGQYFGTGVLTIWNASPICKGIGILIILNTGAHLFTTQTFSVLSLNYVVQSIVRTELPWETCNHYWNNDKCVDHSTVCEEFSSIDHGSNWTYHAEHFYDKMPYEGTEVCFLTEQKVIRRFQTENPVWQYLREEVTGPYFVWFDEISPVFVVLVFISWLMIFLGLFRGVNKIRQILMICVGTFFVILLILFISALYFSLPTFNLWSNYQLLHYDNYFSIFILVIYQCSVGQGVIITVGSHMKYHNNTVRDALIITGIQMVITMIEMTVFKCLTQVGEEYLPTLHLYNEFTLYESIPAYLTLVSGTRIFTTLFFFGHFMLTVCTSLWMVETLITALTDQWTNLRNYRVAVVGVFCFSAFTINIFFFAKNTLSLYATLDHIFKFTFFVCMMECLFISLAYGHRRFLEKVKHMYGVNKFTQWCYWSWVVISPAFFILCQVYEYEHFILSYFKIETVINMILALIPVMYGFGLYMHSARKNLDEIMRPDVDY